MHANAQLIENFYAAFSRRDHAAMNACYALNAEFSDPLFSLKEGRVRAMWHMLLAPKSHGFALTHSGIEANDSEGAAHWEADYVFTATGRKVHNVIDSRFRFKDGKIVHQQDSFDLYRWTRMALGPAGVLLGWTPLLQNKVKKTANGNLAAFIEQHPEYR